jgi:hypothetical protein
MKTTKILALAVACSLGLTMPAWSTQSEGDMRDGRLYPEDQGMLERTGTRGFEVLKVPFGYVGRAGVTVLHTPSIILDSLHGEREFRSSDGKFWGRSDGKYDRDGLFD